MRNLFFLLMLAWSALGLKAQNYQSHNMQLLGHWDNDSLHSLDKQTFNEIWGYVDSATSREYAIMGSVDSIYFFEILANGTPVLRDVEAGRSNSAVNRDFQTYKHYCYAVVDQGSGSLQIFDMQYLPDSVSMVYDSDSLSVKSHTICIEKDRMYLNSNTTKNGFKAMQVFSLANDPLQPELLGTLSSPIINGTPMFSHVHDMIAVNDTAWCSNGYSGLYVYDYRNAASPVLLNVYADYPEKGYNHNGWLSPDHKYFVFTDENNGAGVKLIQVDNLADISLVDIFRSNPGGAITHNPFIRDSFIYTSAYHDGVYIYDFRTPSEVKMVAYFDTYWQNDQLPAGSKYNGFEGCWGIYPFFPSGNIVASDMSNGIFVLKPAYPLGIEKEDGSAVPVEISLFPNPSNGNISLDLFVPKQGNGNFRVYSLEGKEVWNEAMALNQGRNKASIRLENLSAGSYIWEFRCGETRRSGKLMIQ